MEAHTQPRTQCDDSEEDWSDWEEDCLGEGVTVKSLFDESRFDSIEKLVDYDEENYGFNIYSLKQQLGLDMYGFIRLVNYVRLSNTSSKEDAEALRASLAAAPGVLRRPPPPPTSGGGGDEGGEEEEEEEDPLLRPALADDPLLYHQGFKGGAAAAEEDEEEGKGLGEEAGAAGPPPPPPPGGAGEAKGDAAAAVAAGGGLAEQLARARALVAALAAPEGEGQDNDTYYFDSYTHFGIHETMLRDKPRTGAYEDAIMKNKEDIEGKVVLDVGCGSGVLSLFAARAGARRVIGVDRSGILRHAREVVALNGAGGTVELIQGKIEDLDLPVDKVDLIVSEWMGYALLYEAMLPSVLLARDRYLKPGGGLLPNTCRVYLEGVQEEGRVEWWADVHGLDMRPLRDLALREPSVEVLDPAAVLTDTCLVQTFDLLTVKDEELDFESSFTLVAKEAGTLHAFCIWFDTGFEDPVCQHHAVTLSTSPRDEPTHWKQAVLWIHPDNMLSFFEAGESVKGTFSLKRGDVNPRELDLEVKWWRSQDEEQMKGGENRVAQAEKVKSQQWHMGS